MTDHFYRKGEELSRAPYQYRGCGLDGIYLCNGYDTELHDGEIYTTVKDVDGLHRAIALHLVKHRKVLVPKEIRFLRKTMDLTQAEMAKLMSQSSQQIARWEKGQSEMPGPADRWLRTLYLMHMMPGDVLGEALKAMTTELDEIDEVRDESMELCMDPEWKIAA